MLERNPANYAPLSPVAFLRRTAEVYPDKIAVIHGDASHTYREFEARCRRLASGARPARRRSRRHGRGDGAERARAPRSALRGARLGRGAQRAQISPRRGDHRVFASTTAKRRY
jgi:non-ribosomal peptide synthetase component F